LALLPACTSRPLLLDAAMRPEGPAAAAPDPAVLPLLLALLLALLPPLQPLAATPCRNA
jgi:hypothetical protein